MEGDDVAVVGGAGMLVAGAADDAEVVAVDDHRGVVTGGVVGGPDGNEAGEGPAQQVGRIRKCQPAPLVRQSVTLRM